METFTFLLNVEQLSFVKIIDILPIFPWSQFLFNLNNKKVKSQKYSQKQKTKFYWETTAKLKFKFHGFKRQKFSLKN